MRATLTRSSPLRARPANSSIVFGGSPAASTRTGDSINSGMGPTLVRDPPKAPRAHLTAPDPRLPASSDPDDAERLSRILRPWQPRTGIRQPHTWDFRRISYSGSHGNCRRRGIPRAHLLAGGGGAPDHGRQRGEGDAGVAAH